MVFKLEWPGLSHLSFVIIDPKSNRVFSKKSDLESFYHLDSFENKYAKLSDVFDMFPQEMHKTAHWTLQDLIKNFKRSQLKDITTKNGSPPTNTTVTYVPVSTLLTFVLVWPYCKSFKKVKNSMIDFLEHYSTKMCMFCGHKEKDCSCASINDSSKIEIPGYSIYMTDRGSQTSPLSTETTSQDVKFLTNGKTLENHSLDVTDKNQLSAYKSEYLVDSKHEFSRAHSPESEIKKTKNLKVAVYNSTNNKRKRDDSEDRVFKKKNRVSAVDEAEKDRRNQQEESSIVNIERGGTNSNIPPPHESGEINKHPLVSKLSPQEGTGVKINRTWRLLHDEGTDAQQVYGLYLHLPSNLSALRLGVSKY